MKKRIEDYVQHMDELIKKDAADTDWSALLLEHQTQIGFFQHERLIHLLVTITFAILTMMSLLMMIIRFQPVLLLLFFFLLILLIPYLSHYYLLENSVQKMYSQYDRIKKNSCR